MARRRRLSARCALMPLLLLLSSPPLSLVAATRDICLARSCTTAAFSWAIPTPPSSGSELSQPQQQQQPRAYPPAVPRPARQQLPVRVYEKIPQFPESPASMVEALCESVVQGLRRQRRLRVELQNLHNLAQASEQWKEAVAGQAGCLPLYEQVLLSLRARGYKQVLAVFQHQHEAAYVQSRLKAAGSCPAYQVEYLSDRSRWMSVGHKQLVIFFHPRSSSSSSSPDGDDDYSQLSEFQRVTAVATLRGTGVVAVNPRMHAFAHAGGGGVLLGGAHPQPLVLSDFKPCFSISVHVYRYNTRLSHSILMRTTKEEGQQQQQQEEDWEVYLHDDRLPDSGWAFMESGPHPPLNRIIEDRYYETPPFPTLSSLLAPPPPQEQGGGGRRPPQRRRLLP